MSAKPSDLWLTRRDRTPLNGTAWTCADVARLTVVEGGQSPALAARITGLSITAVEYACQRRICPPGTMLVPTARRALTTLRRLGRATSSEVAQGSRVARPTVVKRLRELHALGLAARSRQSKGSPYTYSAT